MDFSKINPFVRSAGIVDVSRRSDECIAYDARIFYMISGEAALTVDGKKTTVERQYQLIDAMLDARVGDTVTLEIERDEIAKNLQITITSACLTAY